MSLTQAKIDQLVADNQSDFLTDLQQVLAIPSVLGPEQTGAPFGRGPSQALELVLEMAQHMGFETRNIDGAIGYAQWGSGDDYVAIIGHLDVVAEGSDWDYPPFDLTQVSGKLYGRGVLDNKGPILSALYGLKLVKSLNVPLKHAVRVIFGTHEESGSQDIPYYLAQEKAPIFGFTPDCKWPVVYGERGILGLNLSFELSDKELARINRITGHMASDHIPDDCTVTIDDVDYHVPGRRSPSNAPELGVNSLIKTASLIAQQLGDDVLAQPFAWLAKYFDEDHTGRKLGLEFEDPVSGRTQVSPYALTKQADQLVLGLSIRYPVNVAEQMILDRLASRLPKGVTYQVTRRLTSHVMNPDRHEIQQLSQIYQELTGLDGTPQTTTGATYARFFPNIVAFGPSYPDQKGIAHNQNEWMNLADLMMCMRIYTRAVIALASDEEVVNA